MYIFFFRFFYLRGYYKVLSRVSHAVQQVFVGYLFYTHTHTHIYIYICAFGEGNGTPLQYSCLENPMGRGAW